MRCAVTLMLILWELTCSGQQVRGAGVSRSSNVAQGDIYALVVGISDYKNIGDLEFADADAIAFSNLLKTSPLRAKQIFEFYNGDATKANIIEKGFGAIDLMVSRNEIKENDIIIIYLAGHGGAYNVTDSFFFPYDALSMTDGGSSVSIFDIKSDIGKWAHKGRRAILVFDACRSSTISDMSSDAIKLVSDLLERPNGSILLAASSGGKEALESGELKHGIFTYYLLKGLYGEADDDGDEEVTLQELGAYIYRSVKIRSDQKPKIDYANLEELGLTKVDKSLASLAEQNINNPKSFASAIAMRGSSSVNQPGKTGFESLVTAFDDALGQGKLLGNDGAYFFYQQMEQINPADASMVSGRTSLIAGLYESAREVLENDLKGLRLYMEASRQASSDSTLQRKSAYDLSYYRNALALIDLYLQLKGENRNARKIKYYFEGRHAWLEFRSVPDSAEFMSRLQASLDIFAEAVKKFPDEPYLLEGYAISLTEYISQLEDAADPSDIKKVKMLLERAMKLAPRWSFPVATMGDLYYHLDEEKLASEWHAKAIRLNPKDPYPYVILGDIHFDNDEFGEAVRYYEKAYALDTTMVYALESLGMASFEAGNVVNGRMYYEKLMRLSPEYLQAVTDYADYLLDTDVEKAIALFKMVHERDPSDDYALYSMAMALNDHDRNEEALIYIKKACAIAPDYYNQYLLGRIHYDAGDLSSARRVFEGLMKEYPHKAEVVNWTGLIYHKQENFVKAKSLYRKAYSINPKKLYFKNLVTVFDRLEQADSIGALYEAIKPKAPKTASHYNELGNALYELRRYEEAKVYYEHAWGIDPKYYWALYNIGLTEYFGENPPAALEMFRKAAEINPDYAAAWAFQGRILRETGNPAESAAYYAKAAAIAEENYGNNNSFDLMLTIASYKRNAGEYDQAHAWLMKALEVKPEERRVFQGLGYLFLRKGDFAQSAEYFRKALELLPDNPVSLYDMACHYGAMGDVSNAITWLEKALRSGYKGYGDLIHDIDLASIRQEERFKTLMKQHFNK